MASKFMLIADDFLNLSAEAKKRSEKIQSVGLELAEKLGSPVKLLYVQDPKNITIENEQVEKATLHLQERFSKGKRKVQVISVHGNPVDEIFRIETDSPPPGMIVMGTQGKQGLERMFLGSVADEVVRNAVVPVMIIGPKVKDTGAGKTKILVATDLTKNSRRAESYAMKLAKALNAEVVLIHSLMETLRIADQYAAASGTIFLDQTTIDTLATKTNEALMKKVKLFKVGGVKCSFVVDLNSSTSQTAITEESAKGYRYLVLGTHGRSTFVRAFLGSTAKETIMNSPVPVIVLRSHEK